VVAKRSTKRLEEEFNDEDKKFVKSLCERVAIDAAIRLGDLNALIMYGDLQNYIGYLN
jgi:hypothetical protein